MGRNAFASHPNQPVMRLGKAPLLAGERGGRLWHDEELLDRIYYGEPGQVYGATTDQLAEAFSFVSEMNAHPMFGHLNRWGQGPDSRKRLPPVLHRQREGSPAAEVRSVRVPNGWPTWDADFDTLSVSPSSPSRHAAVTPMLPRAAKLRASQSCVATSTAPWFRLPPRTAVNRQTYEAMFGPAPSDPGGKAAFKLRPPPRVRHDLLLHERAKAAAKARDQAALLAGKPEPAARGAAARQLRKMGSSAVFQMSVTATHGAFQESNISRKSSLNKVKALPSISVA